MPLPNIGLLIEVSNAHARGLIRGISRYAQANGPWELRLIERLYPADIRRWLAATPFDGLIVRVETPAVAEAIADMRRCIVNVGGSRIAGPWTRVDTDNSAVCGLAAAHLIERGYRCFGFCGMPRHEWSAWRRDDFAAALKERGLACESIELPSLALERILAEKDRRALGQWIAQLPKPLGVMACNDHCGRAVLEACREAGVRVPDDVGVIGVDNDDLICELCSPPLSSIEANCDQIGYVAAETLGRMLRGERRNIKEILIKPTTLVSRRSTDATAVREPIVAEALRFIRAYGCTDIGAAEVAGHVHVSRRYLEQQFRKLAGRSIHREIQRVRLETAQRLLGETDWCLQVIAERAGFKQAAHMSGLFFKRLRLRPGEYRRRIQNRLET